jgi:RNA polymerase sigma-70 factor (ECF subfamily)
MTHSTNTGRQSGQGASRIDPRSWVEAHGDALFRYAMLQLRDRDAAEDAVQDCFLAALGARERFSAQASERTWLIGILKHKIIDRIRSRQRDEQASPATTESETEFFDQKGLWRAGPRRWPRDPVAAAQHKEFWPVLRACLDKLPAGVRDAFLLRELDHMESGEIHDVLNISQANLWQRLHRARLLLRRCLELNWFRPPKARRRVAS